MGNVNKESKQIVIPSFKNLKTTAKATPQLKSGYCMGSPEHLKVKKVLEFELKELGNIRIIEEAAKSLGCSKDLASVLKAIEKRWGQDAEAVWLCDNKKGGETSYGYSRQFEKTDKTKLDGTYLITLPENAEAIIDLKGEGKLYVYNKEIKYHKF